MDRKEYNKMHTKRWKDKNKDKVSIYNKKYNQEHPEKRKEIKKRYKQKHPERVAQQEKNWRKNNMDKVNQYSQDYKQIEENRIKAVVRELTWQRYGSAKVCSLCNSIFNVEHHHSKPYNADNFIDLCKSCHEKLHKMEKKND